MKKPIFVAPWPLALGVLGGIFPYFFPFPEITKGGDSMLSSFAMAATLFTTFTGVSLSFFLSNLKSWVSDARKRRVFLSLVHKTYYSLGFFVLLLIVSILGFFFYDWDFYPYILFTLFGFCVGDYLNMVVCMIKAGYKVAEDEEEDVHA